MKQYKVFIWSNRAQDYLAIPFHVSRNEADRLIEKKGGYFINKEALSNWKAETCINDKKQGNG